MSSRAAGTWWFPAFETPIDIANRRIQFLAALDGGFDDCVTRIPALRGQCERRGDRTNRAWYKTHTTPMNPPKQIAVCPTHSRERVGNAFTYDRFDREDVR